MIDTVIAPALTAEEWATKTRLTPNEAVYPVQRAKLIEYADTQGWVWNSLSLHGKAGGVFINSPDMHAIAAFCLHNQPFGFTQADVDDELDLATSWEAEARISDEHGAFREDDGMWGGNSESCRRRAALARSRAARIAALLPPVP